MEFIYPQPERQAPSRADIIDLLHSTERAIWFVDQKIERYTNVLNNLSAIENIFYKRDEVIELLAHNKAVKARLERMFNRQLESLKIKTT